MTARVLASLTEWSEAMLPGVVLSPAGRSLAARLAARGEPRLQVDELREGLRIRARSWVGVVRLDDVEIRIAPKLAGDHLGLVRLLECVSGLEGLSRAAGEASIQVAGDSLFDLVAALFAEAWHSDWSFLPRPPSATLLYSEVIPPVGGDTLFANQYAAWDALPADTRTKLAGLQGIHSARRGYSRAGAYGERDKGRSMTIRFDDSALATELHPIGRVHPETGRTGQWTEDEFVTRFRAGNLIPMSPMPWAKLAGMSEDDIRAIYRYLKSLPPVKRDVGPPVVEVVAKK